MALFSCRKKVTDMNLMTNMTNANAKKGKDQMSDKDILDFYNLATGRLLTGLEVSTQAYDLNISKLYKLYTRLLINILFIKSNIFLF